MQRARCRVRQGRRSHSYKVAHEYYLVKWCSEGKFQLKSILVCMHVNNIIIIKREQNSVLCAYNITLCLEATWYGILEQIRSLLLL